MGQRERGPADLLLAPSYMGAHGLAPLRVEAASLLSALYIINGCSRYSLAYSWIAISAVYAITLRLSRQRPAALLAMLIITTSPYHIHWSLGMKHVCARGDVRQPWLCYAHYANSRQRPAALLAMLIITTSPYHIRACMRLLCPFANSNAFACDCRDRGGAKPLFWRDCSRHRCAT